MRVGSSMKNMERAHDACLEVAQAPEEVDRPPEVLALERDGHGVHGEVPAEEVLPERRPLDAGKGRRVVVELGAGRGDVDARPVPDDRSAELLVRDTRPPSAFASAWPNAIPSPRPRCPRRSSARPSGRAGGAADEVDAVEPRADGLDRLEDGREMLERERAFTQVGGRLLLRDGLLERAGGRCA